MSSLQIHLVAHQQVGKEVIGFRSKVNLLGEENATIETPASISNPAAVLVVTLELTAVGQLLLTSRIRVITGRRLIWSEAAGGHRHITQITQVDDMGFSRASMSMTF